MITNVKPPVWMPDKREWVLEIPMHDNNIGDYIQVVRAEALISITNYIKLLKEKGNGQQR